MPLKSGETANRTLSPLGEDTGWPAAACGSTSWAGSGAAISRPRNGSGLGHCPGRLERASNERYAVGLAASAAVCEPVAGNDSYESGLLCISRLARFIETDWFVGVVDDRFGYGIAGALEASAPTGISVCLTLRLSRPDRSRLPRVVVVARVGKLPAERVRSSTRLSDAGDAVPTVPTGFTSVSGPGRLSSPVEAGIACRLALRTSLADEVGNSLPSGWLSDKAA
jgi:hypothetical protein